MMVTGTRCALPLAASCRTPSARGPLVFGAFFANCANPINAHRTKMTTTAALRYNRGRTKEDSMEINDKAPDFTSVDQDGKKLALNDYKGKWVVLYFYPRADTPGCTIEACSF